MLTRIVAIACTLAAMLAIPLSAASTANASPCGFIGGETYNHCSTRTHVLIDAQNIWGKTYRDICVGPGKTHLGYLDRWVISYAWYKGRTCRG